MKPRIYKLCGVCCEEHFTPMCKYSDEYEKDEAREE